MKKTINIRIVCFVLSLLLVISGAVVFAQNEENLKENFVNDKKVVNAAKYGVKGDGVTDDTQALQRALLAAYQGYKTLYLPQGTYKVSDTLMLDSSDGMFVKIYGDGKDKTVIEADSSMDGSIISSGMRSGFMLENLTIKHNGTGKCVDSIYLNALHCSFISNSKNDDDVVSFAGSNCRITECNFYSDNPQAYLLRYSYKSTIAINSYIIDNTFSGKSKGIIVDSQANSRVEGLKISGNIFTNTGTEQIRMETILHCDISENKMSGSSGSAIVIVPEGLMVHGLFVCRNNIQAANACIYEAPLLKGSTDIHISENILKDSDYGVSMNSTLGLLVIDNNQLSGMKCAGIEFSEIQQAIVCNNKIEVMQNAESISIYATGSKIIITGNTINKDMDLHTDNCVQVVENNKIL